MLPIKPLAYSGTAQYNRGLTMMVVHGPDIPSHLADVVSNISMKQQHIRNIDSPYSRRQSTDDAIFSVLRSFLALIKGYQLGNKVPAFEH